MGFEVFQKGSAPVATVPSVTIQKRGHISLNRAAHELIDAPKAVELLWDAERKVVGVRPADLSNPNAYPARRQVTKNARGPVLIAGSLFAKYAGLDTSVAQRWTPTVEDGVLCIDTSRPGHKVTSNRGSSKEPSEGNT